MQGLLGVEQGDRKQEKSGDQELGEMDLDREALAVSWKVGIMERACKQWADCWGH